MSDRGAEPEVDWRHARTERLWLDEAVAGDVDDLWAIHSDPASWTHFPQGLHTDRSQTPELVATSTSGFAAHGLSYWSVRDDEGGPVIGWGGCRHVDTMPWWNLAYRFSQQVLGRGYASEMGRAALGAAHVVRPDLPVLAYLLEHNVASRRTAERLGMALVWRGPDIGNRDPDAIRLVFCDREPTAELAAELDEKFRSV